MINNPDVKSEKVVVQLDKLGHMRTVLVVQTGIALSPLQPGFDETRFNALVEAAVRDAAHHVDAIELTP